MRVLAAVVLAAGLALLPSCDDGPYAPPPGEFYCGSSTCDVTMQICLNQAAATSGEAGETCASPPPSCNGAPACPCAASACGNGQCTTASDGSVTVTCPGE